jgi:NhaA family Na+:H+ antiporter
LLYLAVAGGGAAGDGWGIPMATDIAMAVGVIALLGARVHPSLKLFLLALAIVDDIGAIVVIAIFYSSSVDVAMLGLAALALVGMLVLRSLRIYWSPVYVVLGASMWLALHEAGVHATLAGVACGLLAPAVPHTPPELVDVDELTDVSSAEAVATTVTRAKSSVSVVEWLEHVLHPWSSFVIVPIFALANAGIEIGGGALRDAAQSRVTLGIVLGLVVGKPLGIALASWVAVRTRLGMLASGVGWSSLIAVASVAGIGFTVSLFISELAFDDPRVTTDAKLGVLAASIISAILGSALIVTRSVKRKPGMSRFSLHKTA